MTTLEILPSPSPIDLTRAGTRLRGILSTHGARRVAERQLARASPTHRVAGIMIFIMIGIAIAMITTPDPLWWQLHFSELGTFNAFSSYVFNGTLFLTGALIVAFARYFRRELAKHAARSGSWRGSPIVVSILFGSLGVHLAFVGGVPVNTWTFLHDRGAQGMVFSFLAILICVPSMLRGLGRPLAAITAPAIALLVGGGVSMVVGVINLAAYELLGFAVMFTWVLLFVACLGKHEANHDRSSRTSNAEGRHVAPARRRRVSAPRRALVRESDRQFIAVRESIARARTDAPASLALHRTSHSWTPSGSPPDHARFTTDAAPHIVGSLQRNGTKRRHARHTRTPRTLVAAPA
ncbi:DUF998 domain-containing protein [Microbacterium rhizomatis]|nr:DUF998 domain-containing protein [Microbacterium rhizomatis]